MGDSFDKASEPPCPLRPGQSLGPSPQAAGLFQLNYMYRPSHVIIGTFHYLGGELPNCCARPARQRH
eukprot:scaffold135481_cov18-Prasinocladus_malaysianus.AAC.1